MLRTLLLCTLIACAPIFSGTSACAQGEAAFPTYRPDHPYFQYMGRFDFSNPLSPKAWAPGACITFRFEGTGCEISINDESPEGNYHNYLQIVIDGTKSYRIKLQGKNNSLKAAGGLSDGEHTMVICKSTEAMVGYIALVSVTCRKLLPPAKAAERKLEFIGGASVVGMGADDSGTPCGNGQWYDQENAWISFAAVTARMLKAQWHLTASSGSGLYITTAGVNPTVAELLYKTSLRNSSTTWDNGRYQPHLMCVVLGSEKELMDTVLFTKQYDQLLRLIRRLYPRTDIVCIDNPELDNADAAVLKRLITRVIQAKSGPGARISWYFFQKTYQNGCDSHPSPADHRQMAVELKQYISRLKGW